MDWDYGSLPRVVVGEQISAQLQFILFKGFAIDIKHNITSEGTS